MFSKTILIGFAVLGISACASTPSARFAGSVKDAQAANRPLVIYEFVTTGQYAGYEHYPTNKVIDTYAGLSFINTAQVPIQQVVFDISSVSRDGKPLTGELTAVGNFLPGSSYSVVSKSPLWTGTGDYACPNLTGISVRYQDGSTASVAAPKTSPYLTPQINIHCAPYTRVVFYQSGPPNGAVGPGHQSSVSNVSPGHGT